MSVEILGLQTRNSEVETESGLVNFEFTNALVNGERSMSSAADITSHDAGVDLSIQLAVPNSPEKISFEMKKAKERAFTMQSGLAVIENMRHSLFDFDFVDKYFYDGVRWNLSRIALSHSMALNNNDNRPNRFRLDRPFTLERLLPVVVRLVQEEELYGQPQQILHEGIRSKTRKIAA